MVVLGTSRSYMMYMVRGNRGGAETDGRAEDPFEAAARGASASAPWKLLFFLYLTLYPFPSSCLPSSLPYRVSSLSPGPSFASTATQSSPEEKPKSALNPCPGATLQHRLNHLLSSGVKQKIFLNGFLESEAANCLWFVKIRFTLLVTFVLVADHNTTVGKKFSLENVNN